MLKNFLVWSKKKSIVCGVSVLSFSDVLLSMEARGGAAGMRGLVGVGLPVPEVVVTPAQENQGQLVLSTGRELSTYHYKTVPELLGQQSVQNRFLTIPSVATHGAAHAGASVEYMEPWLIAVQRMAARRQEPECDVCGQHACVRFSFVGQESVVHGSQFKAHGIDPLPEPIDCRLLRGLKRSVYTRCLQQMADNKALSDAQALAGWQALVSQAYVDQLAQEKEKRDAAQCSDGAADAGYMPALMSASPEPDFFECENSAGSQMPQSRSWVSAATAMVWSWFFGGK